MTEFILSKGLPLLEKGYSIVPIRPNAKHPGLDNWSSLTVDEPQLKKYAANGFAKGGVGILAKHTPGIDIDVQDKSITLEVIKHVSQLLGEEGIMMRIGKPPKVLIPCKTDKPFTKVSSRVWKDIFQEEHKLEILGDGQQWVAYGIHPDTHKPYRWRNDNAQPSVIERDYLPALTHKQAQEMVRWFEDQAPGWGWVPKKASTVITGGQVSDTTDPDTADDLLLLHHKEPLGVTEEQMRADIEWLDPDMLMADWVIVGMASYHESGGSSTGFTVWNDWSKAGKKYRRDEMVNRYKTFKPSPGKDPVTWDTVRHKVKLVKQTHSNTVLTEALERITTCLTPEELTDEVCPDIQQSAFDGLLNTPAMARIEHAVKTTFKKLADGANLPTAEIRALINPETHALRLINADEGAAEDLYPWSIGWLFITNGDFFFHPEKGIQLTEKGFNALFNRELMGQFADDDSGRLSTSAAELVKNIICCPVVNGIGYLPDGEERFTVEGMSMANTYKPGELMVDKGGSGWTEEWEWTDADREAIQIVLHHLAAIIPDTRDRDIVLNFLANRTKHVGKKTRWALMIQGMPGDGKTFIHIMMSIVLGVNNVRTINASETEEKFNAWATGSQIVFIEELKMHGHNRYDVVNKMKPLISNDYVSVREMQRSSYQAMNVTDYVAFSNYQDGIPIDLTDRRWFITFSSLQSLRDLERHVAHHGFTADDVGINNYFDQLFTAIRNHAPAIGGWLRYAVGVTEHIAPEYNLNGRAPMTHAKSQIIQSSRHELEDMIDDFIDDDRYPEITHDMLNFSRLKELIELDYMRDATDAQIRRIIQTMGFMMHTRVRLPLANGRGDRVRVYTKREYLEQSVSLTLAGVPVVGDTEKS